MSLHNVVTKDYPENVSGGIMVCGINFGYSNLDEGIDASGEMGLVEQKSFFSDKSVNNTKFRNRILAWLSGWGVELESEPGKEGALERRFFQTNWLDTQTKSIDSDGKITVQTLVDFSGPILNLIKIRRPKLIIFVGAQLIEALNDISIRDDVVSMMGERSGNAAIYQCSTPEYTGIKFKVLFQKFGDTLILSLPHTASIGLTNEYLSSIKLPDAVIQTLTYR